MSDPMTNTEVEDVLASIRRLVSDDKRAETAPVQKPPSDRLVLTPSLRVMDEDVGTEAETDEQAEGDAPDATPWDVDEAAHASDDRDEPAPEAEAAESDRDAEAQTLDDLSFDVEEMDVDLSQDVQPAQENDPADGMAQAEDFDWPEAISAKGDDALMTTPSDAGDPVETHAAPESEASDTADDDAQGQHGSEYDELVPEDFEFSMNLDEVEDEDVDHETFEDLDVAPGQSDDAAEPHEDSAQSLSAKIAALEMLVGKRKDRFEPDDPGVGAYAGTEAPAMAWEDAEEAPTFAGFTSTRTIPEVEDEDDAEESAAQIFASDEDVLDEEALRELVSDIVREELQGALGERITRNVRKLVRREIHRALAAQELE